MADEQTPKDGIEVVSNDSLLQTPDTPVEEDTPAVEPEKLEETPPVEPVEEIQATEPEAEPTTTEPIENIPAGTEPEATEPVATVPGQEIDTEPVTVESLQKEIIKLNNRHGYMQRQIEKGGTKIIDKEVPMVTPEPDPTPVVPDFKDPKPSQDDFENFDEYNDALLDWKVDAKLAQQEAEKTAKENDVVEKGLVQDFHKRLAEGEEKYPDFAESITDVTVPFNHGIVNLIRETDNPADVSYYLAKNRKDCAAISQMTPARAAMAIIKIDKKFTAEPVEKLPSEELEKIASKQKSISSAPAPIVPIGSRETVIKDKNKMTQREYELTRTAEKKAAGIL